MDPQSTTTPAPRRDASPTRAAIPGPGDKRVVIVMPYFNAAKTLAVLAGYLLSRLGLWQPKYLRA